MPAHAGTGREAHEAEGLGRGGVDGLPDVDAEVPGEHGDLVDERDVDMPERVLEELGELGHPRARDRHGLVHDAVEEALAPRRSDASSMPETTFGMVTRFHVGFPGSIRSGL